MHESLLILGPGTSAQQLPHVLSTRGTAWCWQTTGTPPSANSSTAWSAAEPASPRPMSDRRRTSPRWCSEGPDRIVFHGCEASRPVSFAEPGYTETEQEPDRAADVAEAAGRRRARDRLRQLATRVWPGTLGFGSRRSAIRATGRPGTPLQGLRRAAAADGGRAPRLLTDLAAPRDRLRAKPGHTRITRVANRRRQVPAPGRVPGAPLPLDGGGLATIGVVHVRRRRTDPSRLNRGAPTSLPRPSPSVTSPHWPRGATQPAVRHRLRSPYDYEHTVAGYLAAGRAKASRGTA